jgi:predicted permease
MARAYHEALQRLEAVPGVSAAGLASGLPMGAAPDSTGIRIPGIVTHTSEEELYANYCFASPGYFSAVGSPLLRGRDFSETDTLSSAPVTIINNAMARKFWPDEDPLGKQVGVGDTRWPVRTIIAVVGDAKQRSLGETVAPEMYVPYTQNEIKIWPSMQSMQVVLRTRSGPESVTTAAREAVRSLDPDLPVANVTTLSGLIDHSMIQPRFVMLLLGSFAALALLLAAIGMYGVVSYSVAQRTREIGVRMALGAKRWDVLEMILSQGARLAWLGILIGLGISLAVTRLMASFLYGVGATDITTYAAVSGLLLTATLLACYLPARRAVQIEPTKALRCE